MLRKFTALIAVAGLLCCLVSPVLADDDVPFLTVNEINFPNSILRDAVEKFAKQDKDEDGEPIYPIYLTMAEVEGVESLTLESQGYVVNAYDEEGEYGGDARTLKGIEYFTNLKSLTITEYLRDPGYGGYKTISFLKEADLSKNTKLESLTIKGTGIKTLDLSKNTALTSIVLGEEEDFNYYNKYLQSVNIDNNSKLTSLTIISSKLTTLDLSKAENLMELNLSDNYSLSTLNLSNNTNLKKLNVPNNSLDALDVSNLTQLKELNVTGNWLTQLDLDNNTSLTKVTFFEDEDYPQYSSFPLQKVTDENGVSYYKVNLEGIVKDFNRIDKSKIEATYDEVGGSFTNNLSLNETYSDLSKGILAYDVVPEGIKYYYDTGLTGTNKYLPVILQRQTVWFQFGDTYTSKTTYLTFTAGVEVEVNLHTSYTPPATWSWSGVNGSTLPPGLKFDENTGKISGTPTEAGLFKVDITLKDSGYSIDNEDNTEEVTRRLWMYVKPKITTSNAMPLITVKQGESDTATIEADGGDGIQEWRIYDYYGSGNYVKEYPLDENDSSKGKITINANGKVSLTTTKSTDPGTYSFFIRINANGYDADDSDGGAQLKDEVEYTVKVLPKEEIKPVINDATLTPGTLKTVYGYKEVEGTTTVLRAALKEGIEYRWFRWTVTGLPKGLYLKATYDENESLVYENGTVGYEYDHDEEGETLKTSTSAWIAGTPFRAGTFTVKVTLETAYGTSDTKEFTLVIDGTNDDTPPEIVLPSKDELTFDIGKELAIPLNATIQEEMGANEAFTWTVTGLPNGLALNTNPTYGVYDSEKGGTSTTAEITGTPTEKGTFTVKVSVATAYGTSEEKTFTLIIVDNSPVIVIPSGDEQTIDIGKTKECSIILNATSKKQMGADEKFTWTVTGLPDGLSLKASTTYGTWDGNETSTTAEITGTPSKTETSYVKITVATAYGTSETKTLKLTIIDTRPVITLPSAENLTFDLANQEKEFAITLKAAVPGKYDSAFTWTVTGLPEGLKLKAAETSGKWDGKETSTTAEIAGTPSKAGTFNVNVTVATVNGTSDTKTFKLVIKDTRSLLAALSEEDLTFYIGRKKELAIRTIDTGEALTCTLKWANTKKAVKGLTLDNKKCLITGVPTSAAGEYIVNATITNKSKTVSEKATFTITLKDTNPALVQGTDGALIAITDAVTGSTYSYTFKTVKDTGNTKWKVWNAVLTNNEGKEINLEDFNLVFTPAKLTLATAKNKKVAFVTGNARAGDYILTITPEGEDAAGEYNFAIRIRDKAAAITTKSLKNASVGSKYSINLAAKEKVTWEMKLYTEECENEAAGDDMPNLALSGTKPAKTNKIISKTNGKAAALTGKAGIYYVKIKITGTSDAEDEKVFPIKINSIKPKFGTIKTAATVGTPYTAAIKVETGETLKWTSSKEPDWLKITEDWRSLTLTGTPEDGKATAGTYKLTVMAENSKGKATKTYTIKVSDVKPNMSKAKLDTTTATIGKDYEGIIRGITGTNLTVKTSWAKNAKGSGTVKGIIGLTVAYADGEIKISGTPAADNKAGKYYLKVTLSNPAKKNVAKTFTITLKPAEEAEAKQEAQAMPEGKAGESVEVEEYIADSVEANANSDSEGLTFTPRSNPEKFKVGGFVPGDDKYIIVAVFDSIEVDSDTDYAGELGPVTIDNIYAGKELIWLPKPSDENDNPDLAENDAERAFFVDEEGRELEDNILPEDEGEEQVISVNTFLRRGITYEPLIVVEAE